jgi:hypothetical protein
MLRSESHNFEDFNKILDALPAVMKSPSSLSSIRNYFQVSFENRSKRKLISKSPSKQKKETYFHVFLEAGKERKKNHLLKQHKDRCRFGTEALVSGKLSLRKQESLSLWILAFEQFSRSNTVTSFWQRNLHPSALQLRENESQVSYPKF